MSFVVAAIIVLVVGYGFTAFFGAPYVPTLSADIDIAFEKLYPLSEKDVLLDLGSGDGRVLRKAVRRGARAVGYELHPILVLISILLSRGLRIETKLVDIWHTSFPDDTTVVYLFSVTRDARRMTKLIQQEATRLGRPLKVISYGTGLPDVHEIQTLGAHHLFNIMPLQTKEP